MSFMKALFQGANSTPELRTYPKIKIEGYKGPAVVVVSCVAHEAEKPRAHPHNLVSPAAVGREGCKRGVCTMNVPYIPSQNEDMTVEFQHLGIQCVTRGKIGEALRQRQQIRVDPFGQGFEHSNGPTAVDLSAVRLCFQVQTMPDNVISPVFLHLYRFFARFSWIFQNASIHSLFPRFCRNLSLMPGLKKNFR